MGISVILGLVLLVTGWFGWRRHTRNNGFYNTIPCVGVREDEWFAWTRAKLRSFSKTEEWMKEGYEKVSNAFNKDMGSLTLS